jgi:hypothetical protein
VCGGTVISAAGYYYLKPLVWPDQLALFAHLSSLRARLLSAGFGTSLDRIDQELEIEGNDS